MSQPSSLRLKIERTQLFIRGCENGLLVALVFALLAIACAQILLRNLADSGLVWGDPLLRILVLWIALVGGMVATRDNAHININLLGHFLRGDSKVLFSALNNAASAVICGLLAWHSFRFVALEKEDGIIAFLYYPAWWFEAIMPLAFSIICLRFSTQVVAQLFLPQQHKPSC